MHCGPLITFFTRSADETRVYIIKYLKKIGIIKLEREIREKSQQIVFTVTAGRRVWLTNRVTRKGAWSENVSVLLASWVSSTNLTQKYMIPIVWTQNIRHTSPLLLLPLLRPHSTLLSTIASLQDDNGY